MNRDLFLNGFIDRIGARFGLSADLAFEVLAIAAVLDLTFDEVMDSVATLVNGNGAHDDGMDGVLIDEEQAVMHVFQVKSGASLGDNTLAKFINDYRNLFVFGNATRLPLNAKTTKALETYRALAQAGRALETQLHFVFGGEINAQNRELVQRHLDASEQLCIYDRNDLYEKIESLIAENRRRKPVAFSFMAQKSNISLKSDPQALISFQIQNVKAINFRLAALDLCRLLDTEKQVNKRIDSIFSDNIRGFLDYNKTNKKIRETLQSDYAEYFPFFNNNITVIADQIKIPKEMQAGLYPIETKNPVIVNGLQTTHVIYEVYQKNPAALEGVYVLVRLYETADPALVAKITDATNTQSPINFRDKISNKDFNRHAKALFELNNIGYLSKRGDTFDNNFSRSLTESIHADTLLKLWYASYFEKPDQAKNSKAKVLEDIFEATTNTSHVLYPLFNGDPNSARYAQLLRTYQLYRFVIAQRNQAPAGADFMMYADELFCYGMHKVGGSDRAHAYQQVFTTIQAGMDAEKANYTSQGMTYSHTSYFKSAKSRYDLDRALGFIEAGLWPTARTCREIAGLKMRFQWHRAMWQRSLPRSVGMTPNVVFLQRGGNQENGRRPFHDSLRRRWNIRRKTNFLHIFKTTENMHFQLGGHSRTAVMRSKRGQPLRCRAFLVPFCLPAPTDTALDAIKCVVNRQSSCNFSQARTGNMTPPRRIAEAQHHRHSQGCIARRAGSCSLKRWRPIYLAPSFLKSVTLQINGSEACNAWKLELSR